MKSIRFDVLLGCSFLGCDCLLIIFQLFVERMISKNEPSRVNCSLNTVATITRTKSFEKICSTLIIAFTVAILKSSPRHISVPIQRIGSVSKCGEVLVPYGGFFSSRPMSSVTIALIDATSVLISSN